MIPQRILVSGSSTYTVLLLTPTTILEAYVHIAAHDKAPTLRRVKHPKTLQRLANLLAPPAPCPTCGQPARIADESLG